MGSTATLTQFLIAITLFVIVMYLIPDRYRLLFGGIILLGALALHPQSAQGFADWLKGL